MNQTIRELYERKSVRVFTDREISGEDKNLILESATMAPTAGNQQLYTIIHVTDQKKKELLAESCDHQPFIAEAKMVLIFCADYLKWYRAYLCAGAEPRKPAPPVIRIFMFFPRFLSPVPVLHTMNYFILFNGNDFITHSLFNLLTFL